MSYRDAIRRPLRALVIGGLVLSMLAVASACQEAFGGPTITSLQIEPNTISKNRNSGMTDQYFQVTIQVTGFEDDIEDVELFIAENDRTAPRNPDRETSINGTTITVTRIQQTWFNGMDPGTYNIGAAVTDAQGTSDTRRDLAEVELTE
jgi:uncharacterized protein (DUF433 family)